MWDFFTTDDRLTSLLGQGQ